MAKPFRVVSGFGIESIPTEEKKTPEKKRIIAWDGEGMNLSGRGKPQHYVLFGCSAETDKPLIGKSLGTHALLDYIVRMGAKYPGAVHIAYSFKYDYNMIIRGLSAQEKATLHADGKLVIDQFKIPGMDNYRWILEYIPGKIFRVSRMDKTTFRTISVRIYDIFSFFARKFLDAAESILKDELNDSDRAVIEHGKGERGDNEWKDIADVKKYWQAEIRIMQRMTERFRDIMYAAGLKLTAWYGPGAIASYLIKSHKLRDHIQNTPAIPAVHEASKWAYAGGRFELFQLGRFTGQKIYGLDLNSAYPFALSGAPSLGVDHGEWVQVNQPRRIESMGVYRIMFKGSTDLFEHRAMPLFHRDKAGGISFPGVVEGWYWGPEAQMVQQIGKQFGGVTIIEGWVWEHDDTRPFRFLEEMYNRRVELGKDNIISMPYKLGPNSMYGKFAQQVGFTEGKFGELSLPPESHCLMLAGWITSWCRAQLYKMLVQIPPEKLIAVETDGIFTTMAPSEFKSAVFGDSLGDWGVSEYDEMVYLRNGIYHRRIGDAWSKAKSRGLDISSVPRERVQEYLRTCGPGNFPILEVELKDRFVGIGAALAHGLDKVQETHCVWQPGKRDVLPGGNGKRIHLPGHCQACRDGLTAWDAPHQLVIHSNAGIKSPILSTQHRLDWETKDRLAGVALARSRELVENDYL